MGEAAPKHLRQLTDLAGRLNDFSRQTNDPVYSALFLKAAEDILQQSRVLTAASPSIPDFRPIPIPPSPSVTSQYPLKPGVEMSAISGNGSSFTAGATTREIGAKAC